MVSGVFSYGLGPRTAISMMRAAKAWSMLFVPEAEVAVPEALARIAPPVLRHRVKLEFDWQRNYQGAVSKGGSDPLEGFVADFIIATAPEQDGYRNTVREELVASGFSPTL